MDKVTTWLWCDGTAEDMAAFYTGLIPDSHIVETVRAPLDTPGGARAGDVLMVEFTLGGAVSPHSTAGRASPRALPCPCRWSAKTRPKWTATGTR